MWKCCRRGVICTQLGAKFLVKVVDFFRTIALKKKKTPPESNQRPRKSHQGARWNCSGCPGVKIILLSVRSGWMAGMLCLAAWRQDWTWWRKWSRTAPGLGEPPRPSPSQTAGSSHRDHVPCRISRSHPTLEVREAPVCWAARQKASFSADLIVGT